MVHEMIVLCMYYCNSLITVLWPSSVFSLYQHRNQRNLALSPTPPTLGPRFSSPSPLLASGELFDRPWCSSNALTSRSLHLFPGPEHLYSQPLTPFRSFSSSQWCLFYRLKISRHSHASTTCVYFSYFIFFCRTYYYST